MDRVFCNNKKEFDVYHKKSNLLMWDKFEKYLLEKHNSDDHFFIDGYCVACDEPSSFLVDYKWGAEKHGDLLVPNWRERLTCKRCQLNNRQRAMTGEITRYLDINTNSNIYIMEQVTPIYDWLTNKYKKNKIIGSEYLGYQYDPGHLYNGIRHEDIEDLSFDDGSLDLIISNDVLEHVPSPEKAISEIFRVLSKDGVLLMSVPFNPGVYENYKRAEIQDGEVVYYSDKVFHGNPVSSEGSLVFTDFGWELVDLYKSAGFDKAGLILYWDYLLGYLGGIQLMLYCQK